MTPKVISQDKDLLIIEKPSGWITNEASTTKSQPVVQTWLKENFDYQIAKSKEFRSGIVHRLDKETSGILVIAKNEKAFSALQAQFKKREVEKKYLALAHGKIEQSVGEVEAPVGRLPWRKDRFGVLPGGREAVTKYKVIDYYENDSEDFSLVELFPKTGRTHQIRIHLKHLGNPIVADDFYAGRKRARKDRLWCPRLFLHAAAISFKHPVSKKKVSFKSELVRDLTKALEVLERVSENN